MPAGSIGAAIGGGLTAPRSSGSTSGDIAGLLMQFVNNQREEQQYQDQMALEQARLKMQQETIMNEKARTELMRDEMKQNRSMADKDRELRRQLADQSADLTREGFGVTIRGQDLNNKSNERSYALQLRELERATAEANRRASEGMGLRRTLVDNYGWNPVDLEGLDSFTIKAIAENEMIMERDEIRNRAAYLPSLLDNSREAMNRITQNMQESQAQLEALVADRDAWGQGMYMVGPDGAEKSLIELRLMDPQFENILEEEYAKAYPEKAAEITAAESLTDSLYNTWVRTSESNSKAMEMMLENMGDVQLPTGGRNGEDYSFGEYPTFEDMPAEMKASNLTGAYNSLKYSTREWLTPNPDSEHGTLLDGLLAFGMPIDSIIQEKEGVTLQQWRDAMEQLYEIAPTIELEEQGAVPGPAGGPSPLDNRGARTGMTGTQLALRELNDVAAGGSFEDMINAALEHVSAGNLDRQYAIDVLAGNDRRLKRRLEYALPRRITSGTSGRTSWPGTPGSPDR